MPYDVLYTAPTRQLGRADVEFQIKRNGSVLGTLTVSKGSIVWFPSGTTYGRKLTWVKFAELMVKKTKHEERR